MEPKINNRLKKKIAAKRDNAEYVPTSLNPQTMEWNTSCKKCYGRGYVSLNLTMGTPVLCTCAKFRKEAIDAKKESIKN